MVKLLCILRARIGTDPNEYDTGWVVGVFEDTHVFGAKEGPPGFTKVTVNLNKNQTEKFAAPYLEEQTEPGGDLALVQFEKREWFIDRAELTTPQQNNFDAGAVTISVNRLGRSLRNTHTGILAKDDPSVWPP